MPYNDNEQRRIDQAARDQRRYLEEERRSAERQREDARRQQEDREYRQRQRDNLKSLLRSGEDSRRDQDRRDAKNREFEAERIRRENHRVQLGLPMSTYADRQAPQNRARRDTVSPGSRRGRFGPLKLVALALGAIWLFGSITNHRSDRDDSESNRRASAKSGNTLVQFIVMPLAWDDVPEPCFSRPQSDGCAPLLVEQRSGQYRVIRCAYSQIGNDKSWRYDFWHKKVPQAIMAIARNDDKAAARNLGATAVNACPTKQSEAEDLFQKNIR